MDYTLGEHYRLKKKQELKTKIGMFEFFEDDIFTYDEETKTFTVHTGVCMFGIEGDLEDFVKHPESVRLRMM